MDKFLGHVKLRAERNLPRAARGLAPKLRRGHQGALQRSASARSYAATLQAVGGGGVRVVIVRCMMWTESQ